MTTSTVSSKGQITIPKKVRDRLGIDRGDRVEFVFDRGGEVSLRPLKRSVRELAGLFAKPDRKTVTQEEMDASVAELLAEEDERIRRGR